MTETKIAEVVAKLAHWGQKDKQGEPYIDHVRAVAEGVEEEFKPVAWLHDVLEDTTITPDQLYSVGISRQTIDRVILLSRVKGEPYDAYIDRIASSQDPGVIQVKLADLRSNLRDGVTESLKGRYEKARDILLSRAGTPPFLR